MNYSKTFFSFPFILENKNLVILSNTSRLNFMICYIRFCPLIRDFLSQFRDVFHDKQNSAVFGIVNKTEEIMDIYYSLAANMPIEIL